MSEEQKEVKEEKSSPLQEQEIDYRRKAVRWVVDQTDKATCPFCAWVSHDHNKSKNERNAFLEGHIQDKHPTLMVLAYQQKSIEVNLREDDPEAPFAESLGVEVTDNLDTFNYLYVPKAIRQEADRNGDRLRWVSPDKAQLWLDRGAEMVNRDQEIMPHQQSTETSHIRTNEMMLVRLGHELVEERRKINESKIDQNLAASREQLFQQGKRSEVAEQAYNLAKKRGYTNEQAMNMAKAFERSHAQMERVGIHIRDRHGDH